MTGVTFNGDAATLVGSGTHGKLYALFAPDVGAYTVAVQTGAAIYSGCHIAIQEWDGADSLGTFDQTTASTTAPASSSITCPSGGVIASFVFHTYTSSLGITSGTLCDTATSSGAYMGSGYRTTTGAVAFSATDAYPWSVLSVPINAASGDTTAPLITGPSGAAGDSTSTKTMAENITAVHTFTANESVTWDLNGGADVALFTINSSTGALAFSSAPNYESPADADSNNTYVVGVRATDAATNAATQTVTITITDADEVSPSLSSAAGASAAPLLCTGSVTTNEATGLLWAVATASASVPGAAQIKAGQDHTGAAALRVISSQAVSSTSITITSGSV